VGAPAASAVPHSPQNFWPGGLGAPHEGHTAASAAPHSPQNFCVGGFSAPQFEQVVTAGELCPRDGGPADHFLAVQQAGELARGGAERGIGELQTGLGMAAGLEIVCEAGAQRL
jgi:hypothetical protein